MPAAQLGQRHGLQRSVDDQSGIALDRGGVGAVVVDAVGVVGERRERNSNVGSMTSSSAQVHGSAPGSAGAGRRRAAGRAAGPRLAPVDDVLLLHQAERPVVVTPRCAP